MFYICGAKLHIIVGQCKQIIKSRIECDLSEVKYDKQNNDKQKAVNQGKKKLILRVIALQVIVYYATFARKN